MRKHSGCFQPKVMCAESPTQVQQQGTPTQSRQLVSLYLSSLTKLASVYSSSRAQLVAARTAQTARVTTSNTWLFGLVV